MPPGVRFRGLDRARPRVFSDVPGFGCRFSAIGALWRVRLRGAVPPGVHGKGGGGAGIFRKKEDLEALRQMIVEVLEG